MKMLPLLFVITSSVFCQAQSSRAAFEKQLLELLKFSDYDFKEIKGEVIQGTTDEFLSTYKMEGAAKNVIQETGLKYFIVTFPETKDSSEAYNAFIIMEESIKNVLENYWMILGDSLTAKTSEEEKQLMAGISIKRKTIRFRKHDGDLTAYYVELVLDKATRKSDFLQTVNIDWTIKLMIHQVLE
jgi:hypothetical protein